MMDNRTYNDDSRRKSGEDGGYEEDAVLCPSQSGDSDPGPEKTGRETDDSRIVSLQRRVQRLERECEHIQTDISRRPESGFVPVTGPGEPDVAELRPAEMASGAGSVVGGGRSGNLLADEARAMKTKTSNKDWFTILVAILIVLVLAGTVLAIYLIQFEDNPPIEFNEITITKSTSVPGEHVEYTVDFCKFTDAAPDRRRFWINGTSTEVPPPDDPPSNLPGCYVFTIKVDVPLELLPNTEYYLMQSFTFQVNPLKERTVQHKIGPFFVLELPAEEDF